MPWRLQDFDRLAEQIPTRRNTCSGVSSGLLPTNSKSPAIVASVLCCYASPQTFRATRTMSASLRSTRSSTKRPTRAPRSSRSISRCHRTGSSRLPHEVRSPRSLPHSAECDAGGSLVVMSMPAPAMQRRPCHGHVSAVVDARRPQEPLAWPPASMAALIRAHRAARHACAAIAPPWCGSKNTSVSHMIPCQ